MFKVAVETYRVAKHTRYPEPRALKLLGRGDRSQPLAVCVVGRQGLQGLWNCHAAGPTGLSLCKETGVPEAAPECLSGIHPDSKLDATYHQGAVCQVPF